MELKGGWVTFSKPLAKKLFPFYPTVFVRALFFPFALGKREIKGFVGWGRKKSGLRAIRLAEKQNLPFLLAEDGFLRSVGTSDRDSRSFSVVLDTTGIYYDATAPSDLERLLEEGGFAGREEEAERLHKVLLERKVSKYNDVDPAYLPRSVAETPGRKVLIIAQTAGDLSLAYGYGDRFSTEEMIDAAEKENPGAFLFLKVHPDVVAGTKRSDLDLEAAKKRCVILSEKVNPFTLLEPMDKVYVKTSQMGFEALLLGKEVVCFGAPFYGGWGLTDDRISVLRRTRKRTVVQLLAGAYLAYPRYLDPYRGTETTAYETVTALDRYRSLELANRGDHYFFGFSLWKREFVKGFFPSLEPNRIFFCDTLEEAAKKGMGRGTKCYVWGRKSYSKVEEYTQRERISFHRVEDGFIRSAALGSDLTRPFSLVVDSKGIYFDPTRESDLETLLNDSPFDEPLLKRAEKVVAAILENRLSKYNSQPHLVLEVDRSRYSKVILVPGQVEDDASILYGGYGMTIGDLLETVRKEEPEAYIIYKPHPDVVAGNRSGLTDDETVRRCADRVVTDASIDSCLAAVDEVRTLTSLAGFDGLLRGKRVVTYGMPFYAGWGLTEDRRRCDRRKRKLTLPMLAAGALLLYPRYVDPETGKLCEAEKVLEGLARGRGKTWTPRIRLVRRIRRWFGW